MASPFSSVDIDSFWTAYEDWQEKVNDYFVMASQDKTLAAQQVRASLNNGELLSALSYDDRNDLIADFRRRVLQFDNVFNQSMFEQIGGTQEGKAVGRAVLSRTDVESNPVAFVLRQLNIQRDTTKAGAEQFYFGRNIPKMQFMKQQMQQAASGIAFGDGTSIFVFDTETVGLSNDLAGVREVSSLGMRYQAGDFVSDRPGQIQSKSFSVSRLGYGSIYDPSKGRQIKLSEHFRRLGGATMEQFAPGDGDEFVKALIPQLKQMKNADYIAGQNVQFDIGQVILNAQKTAAYNQAKVIDGVNVKDLVDSVVSKIERGEVIDTLVRSKQYFNNDIPLAKELATLGEKRVNSLENILLETNLAELIKRHGGADVFSGVQHTADYDTYITGQFLRFMRDILLLGKNYT